MTDARILAPRLFSVLLLVALALLGCGERDEERRAATPAVDAETAEIMRRSEMALRAGRLQEALTWAERGSKRSPDVPEIHFQRAWILARMDRFAEARAAYERTLALDAGNAEAWLNLGNIAARERRFREAIEHYEQAEAAYPARSHVLTGRALLQLGEPDSARVFFEAALREDPNDPEAHFRLSELYGDLGRLEDAVVHARRAVERAPENPRYHYLLGAQLTQAERPEEALPHLRRVVRAQPWHYGALSNLGRSLAQLGRADSAAVVLARADTLRLLQNEIGLLQRMAEDEPENPAHWARLAEKLAAVGRYEEAAQAEGIARSLERP